MFSHGRGSVCFAAAVSVILMAASAASARTIHGMDYSATDDVAYQWNDISLTGATVIDGNMWGGFTAPVPIGFDFSFYGMVYDQINVGVRGITSFGNPGEYLPEPCYSSMFPGYDSWASDYTAIAPYWDDLATSLANNNGVYSKTSGDVGERSMTIQWQDVERMDGAGKATFQMILHEGTNDIEFQYKDVTFENDPSASNGLKADVGIQGDSMGAPTWLRWSRYSNVIADQSAVIFSPRVVESDWSMLWNIENSEVHASAETHAHMEIIPSEPEPGEPYPGEPEHYEDNQSGSDSGYNYASAGSIANVARNLGGTYVEVWSQSEASGGWVLNESSSEIRIGFEASGFADVMYMGFDEYSGSSTVYYDGHASAYLDAYLEGQITVEAQPDMPEGTAALLVETWYSEDGTAHIGRLIDVVVGTPVDIDLCEYFSAYSGVGQQVSWVSYTVAMPEPSTLVLLIVGMLAIMAGRRFV